MKKNQMAKMGGNFLVVVVVVFSPLLLRMLDTALDHVHMDHEKEDEKDEV